MDQELASALRRVKLVVSDLDGTLLGPDHAFSNRNARAVRACLDAGTDFILASGRLGRSVLPYARELGLRGHQICGNGSYTARVEDGGIGHLHSMGHHSVKACMDFIDSIGLQPIVFTPGRILTRKADADTDYLNSYGDAVVEFDPDLPADMPGIIKVLAISDDASHDNLAREVLDEGIHVFRSGARFLEFMPRGVHKGTALRELMADRGLEAHEVLALGDNDNDVGMFEAVELSFAMDGASVAALDAASHQAGPHHLDAVAEVLDLLLAARRIRT